MTLPTKDILAEIERQSPTASRSALSRWMRQNHDALLARIGERPDWTVLAEVFRKAGLTDRSGKPASPETARKAWERVKKAVDAARSKRPPKPKPAVQQTSEANPLPVAEPQSKPPAPADRHYDFRPGRLRTQKPPEES